MPKQPTRDDAITALNLLLGLLDEYPFVTEADRSVALSALITPVVRGAMMVAPLHAASAPTRGTGKSHLFDTATAIATGERCPIINAGSKEEETEKRLATELLAGASIVSVDNLNGEFYGDFLCSAIERPIVKPRILGRSENRRIENHSTFFANGNNLRLVGDVVRRAITCSLDANMERPELRQFKNNPVAIILADRGSYIAACLTIVRAYIEADCPDECRPALASFEDWSRLVRSALVWLGRADPCKTMEKNIADDPALASKRAIVAAWEKTIGLNEPRRTADLITEATSSNDTEMALSRALSAVACAPGRTEIDPIRLGKWLGWNRDTIIDGIKIRSQVDKHFKRPVWWISERGSMSYVVKNGKVVRGKHDQARVDRFCRAVKDQTIPISDAEAMELLSTRGRGKGVVVIHTMCAHEDCRQTMETGNGNDCTCTPQITYYRQPTNADRH